jgi:hypothetical protein
MAFSGGWCCLGTRNAKISKMPKIVDVEAYDGFERKTHRLGLSVVLDEVKQLISGFPFLLAETRRGNGAAVLRELLDTQFAAAHGWKIVKSGGIDWTKCVQYNGAEVCMGVELQISARSDLLTNDLVHLMQAIEIGNIDVGVIVVPSNNTAYYLTDRCPDMPPLWGRDQRFWRAPWSDEPAWGELEGRMDRHPASAALEVQKSWATRECSFDKSSRPCRRDDDSAGRRRP